jgi:mono/diheme cytochrome c family protein
MMVRVLRRRLLAFVLAPYLLTATLTTATSAPAQIVNGDVSIGQRLAQKWCSDCHAVSAEDIHARLPRLCGEPPDAGADPS